MKIKKRLCHNKFLKIHLAIVLLYFFTFFLRINGEAYAQGEANWWYFGQNAGLHFNFGPPVAVTNGQIFATEGCSSISDMAGNLLFYTDGTFVFNKNHIQMPNGFGLMGHNSSTQSSVIIQKPGSTTIYYIFTSAYETQPNGIRYSEVDMTLNAGLGNVTANKNILLNTPSCEKITGVRHCNNKDVWVVTHDWNSNAFRIYLVTSAGVNTVPVVSNAGLVINGSVLNTHGQLKTSPNGKKLGSAVQGMSFELFDFDNSTGVVSNGIVLPLSAGGSVLYGVEFSPDGTKMYGACVSGHIYQFNLCAGSNVAVANSGILINTPAAFRGALQLGPDKKIYVALLQGSWAGVINNPNTLGVGCNFVANGVGLSGRIIRNGFPNFVNYYFKPPPPPFTASVNCLNGIFTAPKVNVTNCSGSTNAITSVSWNFGDPASGSNNNSTINNPSHTFTSAGTYNVYLVLNYTCGNDTIKKNVIITTCAGITVTATPVTICKGSSGSLTVTGNNGTAPYTYTWSPATGLSATTGSPVTANPAVTTTYTVTVKDNTNATASATVVVTVNPAVTVTVVPSNINCSGGTNGSAIANPGNGTTPYTYNWSNGQTTQTATGLSAGNYTVTVTDNKDCTVTSASAIISPPPLLGQFTKGTANCTGCGCKEWVMVNATGGTSPYSYTWPDGYVSRYKNQLCPGTYVVNIIDKNGCSVNVNLTAP